MDGGKEEKDRMWWEGNMDKPITKGRVKEGEG